MKLKINYSKTTWSVNKSSKLIKLLKIKKSKNIYKFSEEQIVAILDLRLQKLTALGINEIELELKKLIELISQFKKILNSKKNYLKLLVKS